MRKLLSLLCLSLFLCGCKKNETTPEAKPVVVNGVPDKTSYTLYEIGTISFSNKLGQGAVITASVNGNPSKVAVVNDSLVAFTVFEPAFRVGANEINFESGGKTVKASFTVTAFAPVNDPQAYFTSFIVSQQQDVAQMQAILNADSLKVLGTEVQTALNQTSSAINSFNIQWASLSAIDKQSLANYIEANKAPFTAFAKGAGDLLSFTLDNQNGLSRQTETNGIVCATGAIPVKYKCLALAIKSQLKDVLVYGTLAAIAGATIPVTSWAGLAVAAVPAALGAPAFIRLSFVSARFVRYHFYIAKVIAYNLYTMVAGRANGNEVIFTKNHPTPLDFTVQLRNIQHSDLSSSLSWLSELVGVIDIYNSLCDRLGASQYKWTYTSVNTKDYNALDLSFLSISNINNPAVTSGVIGGTLLAPTIKFTSNSTTDQLFKFDLVYNDGINTPIKVTVDAILKPFSYKVGFIDGTPVPATQLTFSKDVSRFFTLLNEDGTTASGINYSQVSIANITNPNVTVVPNNVAGSTFSIRLNSTSTAVQTTFFDVLYQSQKVQTLSALVDDSTELYKASMVGNWRVNTYYKPTHDLHITQYLTFTATGNVYITKRIDYTVVPGPKVETFSPPDEISNWTVTHNSTGYHFNSVPTVLTYPVTLIVWESDPGMNAGALYEYIKE